MNIKEFQERTREALSDFRKMESRLRKMSEAEIFEQLKFYTILLASTQLYIKILAIGENLDQTMVDIGNIASSMIYETLIDTLLLEVKKRGKDSTLNLIKIYHEK